MVDKKKEIINTCLQTFVDNGLIEISMRDLGAACDMDAANFYYYFKNRDEVVVACAAEAKERIETELFGTALRDIETPELLVEHLHDQAVELRPLMDFFVSVCVSRRYKEAMRPVLHHFSDRYKFYIDKFAAILCCDAEAIAPHVYTVVNTMLSYMIFGQSGFRAPQLDNSYKVLNELLAAREQKS